MTDLLPIQTAAQVVQQGLDVWAAWGNSVDQYNEWQTGTPTGGPNGDGRYPMKNRSGATVLLLCPAALLSMIEFPISYNETLFDGEALPWTPIRSNVTFLSNFAGSYAEVQGGSPAADAVLTVQGYHAGSITTLGHLTVHPDRSVASSTVGSGSVVALGPGGVRIQGSTPAVPGLDFFIGGLLGRIAS